MDLNLIFLLKMPLIRNWFLSLRVQRTVYEEASLYVSWLLSKMGNDRMGCLTLRWEMIG